MMDTESSLPTAAAMRPTRLQIRETRSGVFYSLGEYTVLGSDPSLPFQLPLVADSDLIGQKKINERHVRIERRPEGYLIKDLRSTDGTFVNDTRISEAWIQPGDEIQLGSYLLMVENPETPKEKIHLSSRNPYWQNQLDRIPAIARSESPVLLLGPSGSGKEVLANALHQYSNRAAGPFISVNCSALSETLIESELFGHIKGSFTGAINDRKGAFESARGGTLFLDEIGDLPYGLQAKLLRALENNEIRPVGADRTIQTNVRILAATHQNLSEKIQEGQFRLDLYYRLAVASVLTPALENRMEDFEEILMSFAKKQRVRFSFNAIQKLKEHHWPGNIRELKNTVSRASAYFPKLTILDTHIPEILDPISALNGQGSSSVGESAAHAATIGPIIKEIEKEMILKRLAANHGNQRKTAADLRMPKSTLHDRLRCYGIDPKNFC